MYASLLVKEKTQPHYLILLPISFFMLVMVLGIDSSNLVYEGYAISLNMAARPCSEGRENRNPNAADTVVSHGASPYDPSAYK